MASIYYAVQISGTQFVIIDFDCKFDITDHSSKVILTVSERGELSLALLVGDHANQPLQEGLGGGSSELHCPPPSHIHTLVFKLHSRDENINFQLCISNLLSFKATGY